MTQLKVPGAIYHAFIDGSGVPSEESWPTPMRRSIGKGEQYVYDVTTEQAELILSHIDDYAHGRFYGDPEDRPLGHYAYKWLRKQGRQLMTLKELGEIMLANYSPAELEAGYGHSCADPTEVGRSAVMYNDINPDGTLN